MSVVQRRSATKTLRPNRRRSFDPREWAVWSLPSRLRSYVVGVDLAALAGIAVTFGLVGVARPDLLLFAALTAGSVLHHEASRRTERIREIAAEGVSYVSPKTVWIFAGLLLLPPAMVATLIAITYLHSWLRLSRVPAHRWVFSASTIVLAAGFGGAVLAAADPGGYPQLPTGLGGFVAIVLAGVLFWLVNYALVVVAIALASPAKSLRRALGRPADQLVEAASIGLGCAVAGLLTYQPWLVLALLVPLLLMQRSLLVSQLERVASTDSLTGLFNPMYWHELARKELERASRTSTSVAVLMIDLDRFKVINDEFGHVAGDQVLRTVARAVRGESSRDDLIGRLAGEEFVLLLPDTDASGLAALAERICERVRGLTVEVDSEHGPATVRGLTISAGGAVYPDAADDLDALLLNADNALFSAKDAGRNAFCVVTPTV